DENIDLLDNVSIYEFENYIPNTLLRDSDVMAMRHSKEIRPILLDHPLVEFCCALPVSFKLQKRIFKDCLGDLIPPFVKSAKKFGFELPFEFWLRETLDNFAREKKYPRKYAKHIFFLDQFFRYQNG
ncbi:MAG: asparagine synthase-related protein, partial [Flammeovirgaceae bacterium]